MQRRTATTAPLLATRTNSCTFARGRRPAPPVLLWRPASPGGRTDPEIGRAVDAAAEALVGAGVPVRPLDWDDHIETLLGDLEVLVAYEGRAGELPAPEAGAAYHDARIRRDVSRADLVHRLGGGGMVVGPPAPRPWQVLGLPSTVAGVRPPDGPALRLQVIGLPGHEAEIEAFSRRLQDLVAAGPR